MSTFADIKGALQERLSSMPNEYPISWENTQFEQTGELFLRSTVLAGETTQLCLGEEGKNETNGIYQIDVFTPKGAGGNCIPDEKAKHFERQYLRLNDTVVRCRGVSQLQADDDTNYYITPVQVVWQAITEAR